jgi:hypothetical protein
MIELIYITGWFIFWVLIFDTIIDSFNRKKEQPKYELYFETENETYLLDTYVDIDNLSIPLTKRNKSILEKAGKIVKIKK